MSKLHPKDRKRVARKLVKRVRRDVGYLLKPRPRLLPFKLWVSLLASLLYLDKKNLQDICLISSTKQNRKQTGKTV